jgi:pentatricopeptide repeat protein
LETCNFIIPSPTVSTYQTVIECCLLNSQNNPQQIDHAIQVLYDSYHTSGLKLSTGTCQGIVSALCKRLQWKKAVDVLNWMVGHDVCPRNIIIYNTIISACAKSRQVGMAKNLLHRMKTQDGIRPDEISYNSVIGACANTAQWQEALNVLDQCYREPGVTPTVFIYTNAMRYVVSCRVQTTPIVVCLFVCLFGCYRFQHPHSLTNIIYNIYIYIYIHSLFFFYP